MKCEHPFLQASCEGATIFHDAAQARQGDTPAYWCVEVKVRCGQCGLPFQFVGDFGAPEVKVPTKPFVDCQPGEFVTKLSLPLQPAPAAKRWGSARMH